MTAKTLPAASMAAASNVHDLLALHDERFVQSAYASVLGRPADPDGFAGYLAQVRAGQPKEQILAALALSDEGRQAACKLTGLSELVRACQQRPGLQQRLIRKLGGSGHAGIEVRLRIIENRIGATADQVVAQAAQAQSILDEHGASSAAVTLALQRIQSAVTGMHTQMIRLHANTECSLSKISAEVFATSATLRLAGTDLAAAAPAPEGIRAAGPDHTTPLDVQTLMARVLHATGDPGADASGANAGSV